jgi:hypothetical protein
MPANDQLTALDATFLELEQAYDSALMHIGGAPVAGGGSATSRRRGGGCGIDRFRQAKLVTKSRLPRTKSN